jgi:hypothetical protein
LPFGLRRLAIWSLFFPPRHFSSVCFAGSHSSDIEYVFAYMAIIYRCVCTIFSILNDHFPNLSQGSRMSPWLRRSFSSSRLRDMVYFN